MFILSFRSHQLLLYPRAYQETQQRYLSTKRLHHQERSPKFHAYPISLKNWKKKQKRLCTCNKKWMSWMPLWRFEWFCDFYNYNYDNSYCYLSFEKKVCGLINISVSLSIEPALGVQFQSIFPSPEKSYAVSQAFTAFLYIQPNLCFLKHNQICSLFIIRSPT